MGIVEPTQDELASDNAVTMPHGLLYTKMAGSNTLTVFSPGLIRRE
jgi:hypothetical protein